MVAVTLTADHLLERAEAHGVSFLDTVFIAANLYGSQPYADSPRARMQLRPLGQDELWQLILPLDNEESPFRLTDESLLLDEEPVADVAAFENDDVVLTYIRGGGRSLTLNTNSRSSCTGCLFCPNVIEDAADATLRSVSELRNLLSWVSDDEEWDDLSGVEVITVCSGCFHNPAAAIEHMGCVRMAADDLGFGGYLHLLSSVVRDDDDLFAYGAACGTGHLTLTLECFTRRNLLLKDTKASLTLEQACRIMDTCTSLGITADFTYVAGLDPLEDAVAGIEMLAEHSTTFPRIQVYQAHNDYMRHAQHPESRTIDYFLELRNRVEPPLSRRGLVPTSWQNYRPLWYTSFAGVPVQGPRV